MSGGAIFRGAHASRVLVSASRRNELPGASCSRTTREFLNAPSKVREGGTPSPTRGVCGRARALGGRGREADHPRIHENGDGDLRAVRGKGSAHPRGRGPDGGGGAGAGGADRGGRLERGRWKKGSAAILAAGAGFQPATARVIRAANRACGHAPSASGRMPAATGWKPALPFALLSLSPVSC